MCTSKSVMQSRTNMNITPIITHANSRPVLQPTCNQISSLKQHNTIKKPSLKSPSPPLGKTPATIQPNVQAKTNTSKYSPLSSNMKSPRQVVPKKRGDPSKFSSGSEKFMPPKSLSKPISSANKLKKPVGIESSINNSSPSVGAPGSIAAAMRKRVAISQESQKMRIAHYGRKKTPNHDGKIAPLDSLAVIANGRGEKRCNFITPNSDHIYVAYHDEEWGVPVHEDNLLFELLVLSSAQVGTDWTSVLMKRQDYRKAFSGFAAEVVAKFTEKKIRELVSNYGISINQARGVVDNAKRILEVQREFGSFSIYLWRFVNHKPISTQYKSCQRIPKKSSKSEAISKDMVKRGFRLVGPTCIHSFMQASGLTNDHLVTCPQHKKCSAMASKATAVPL